MKTKPKAVKAWAVMLEPSEIYPGGFEVAFRRRNEARDYANVEASWGEKAHVQRVEIRPIKNAGGRKSA